MAGSYTYDTDYQLLLKGYNVTVKPSEENPEYYSVILEEGGAPVFKREIPNSSADPDETEEQILEDVAQAAIDLYEAERGTLGMGAQAKRKKMKKKSYLDCFGEEWFLSLKGTPYEEQAYNLLNSYLDTEYEGFSGSELKDLYKQKDEMEYKLKKLNLERMKNSPVAPQIIVIQAFSKSSNIYEAEDIAAYLDKFEGSAQEPEAVRLISEYLDICEAINVHEESAGDVWDSLSEIKGQMKALSLESLQAVVDAKIPTEGMEAFPGMAVDVAEMMSGISLGSELVPMADVLTASKTTKEDEKDDYVPVEERVEELGEYTEGLDPAEVEYPEGKSWNNGDKVSLTKEVIVRGWGTSKKFPKGTKGVVDDLYDKANLVYLVNLKDDKGKMTLTKVPGKSLTKSK
jgi:hypothetical protein